LPAFATAAVHVCGVHDLVSLDESSAGVNDATRGEDLATARCFRDLGSWEIVYHAAEHSRSAVELHRIFLLATGWASLLRKRASDAVVNLKLAVALNNILAAPSFSTWIEGEPLDLAKLLAGGKKPRQLIFYLAHLEDTQRMFFLTLLLEEVLSWTRKQPGTSNLRAIVYFDEVFGYLPPYPANPPTKLPLMTLIKQARAFGVGLLLATQNPVDLDYKALSNAGTWFVGKLQTERDKAQLIEGLLGVAAERGTLSDRGYLESVISALGNRVFLMHDVHRGNPILMQSLQALSFLRGPMSREQVAELRAPFKNLPVVGGPQLAEGNPQAMPVATLVPKCQRCQADTCTARSRFWTLSTR
jgi:hypothetical protein